MRELISSLIGIVWVYYGVYGIIKRRVTFKGHYGTTARIYTGRAAIILSAIIILLGVIGVPLICETWWSPYIEITPLMK